MMEGDFRRGQAATHVKELHKQWLHTGSFVSIFLWVDLYGMWKNMRAVLVQRPLEALVINAHGTINSGRKKLSKPWAGPGCRTEGQNEEKNRHVHHICNYINYTKARHKLGRFSTTPDWLIKLVPNKLCLCSFLLLFVIPPSLCGLKAEVSFVPWSSVHHFVSFLHACLCVCVWLQDLTLT